ncbi:MAG: GAP family protein [Solirubrobacterales bacterium]
MNLHILPLAIAMMAGPQIISSIVLVTAPKPVKPSVAYVAGITLAVCLGIGVSMLFFLLVDKGASLHEGGQKSSTAKVLELAFVALLVALSIRTVLNRQNIKPPKWMNSLQSMPPSGTFKLGIGLVYLMPTDLVILVTCGLDLVSDKHSYLDAAPFIGLVALIASLPLLAFVLFHRRAERAMPAVREWIQRNAWAVNLFVYALFIYLILG